MKKHQLKYRGRIIIYFVIALVVYTLISAVVLVSNEKKSQTSAKIELLKNTSYFVEYQLQKNENYNVIKKSLPQNYRLTLLNEQGNILFDNVLSPTSNHLNRTEISQAQKNGEGFDIRTSKSNNCDYIYYARKTNNNTFIRLAMPYTIKLDNLFQTKNILLYIALLVFLITLVFLIYFTDKVWSVMQTLKKFVKSAEKGEIDYNSVHFPDTDSGEIGNKMVSLYEQLEISKQEIIKEKDLNRKIKQEMTNNIAHELKTPVSSILGYLEILLSGKPIDDERRQYFLERSYSQTLRLSNLINDVSIINKIEESSDLFTTEILNVRDVAQEAINELIDSINDKNITINNDISETININGNHSLLYSIFRNLVENAISYAGENIIVGMESHKEDKEFYYFHFYDTGCGVEEEYLTRLFDRFLRIDKGRSRKNGGTGLGLSIVKHAVSFHQGSIVAKNAEHGGLEFYFSLKK